MQKIQLYIEGQRVDMFSDESVTVTQSIQNVKDIEKVFTDFSRTFNLPASKTNNKIFKHYYNFDIVGGFDARKKVSSVIELNNLPFRDGTIKLDGVDLKDNKAHTYKVTFFGKLANLKDLFGDDKLNDLDFSSYDLDYDPVTVETKLTTAPSTSNHIIAPLITHTQRLFYDSTSSEHSDDNIFYHSGDGNSHDHGVKWNELKYAIRVNKIIEAIETKYSLNFSTDFFKNTTVKEFDELFLWLHRKSGKVENLSGNTEVETFVNGFTDDTTESFLYMENSILVVQPDDENDDYSFSLDLSTISTDNYDVLITKNGTPFLTAENHNNGSPITFSGEGSEVEGDYRVYIISSNTITFSNILWFVSINTLDQYTFTTGSFSTSGTFLFTVSNQMPDIRVVDFLTGLFKTFNLTAYYDNDIIEVKPLNDFYSTHNTYDITEYCDVNDSSSNVALPFSNVVFKFKDTNTFLANKFGEINNRTWGEVNATSVLDNIQQLSGREYKIESPFGHMQYERLNDQGTGKQTKVMYGWSVDNKQSSYLGSPLLFYSSLINVYNTNLGAAISFVNLVDADDNPTSHKQIANLNTPFNELQGTAEINPLQLNFNKEINEWEGSSNKTLFTEYYSNYITSVFNEKNRITKITAYLPLRILLNYTLADRFIISGKVYKINSITTNLENGKSELELLNDL